MSALELIEIPLPPSYAELEQAILAFHAEFYDLNWADHSGTPADMVLLGLAERIVASQKTPETRNTPYTDGVRGEHGT